MFVVFVHQGEQVLQKDSEASARCSTPRRTEALHIHTALNFQHQSADHSPCPELQRTLSK